MAGNEVQLDYFAEHLAQVNKNNQVLASDNICNQQGAIIVTKGQEITPQVARQLALHKLISPLHSSINLKQVRNSKQMCDALIGRLNEIGFAPMIKKFDLFKEIIYQLNNVCSYPMVGLKLTILAERFPSIFNRELISAVIALAICRELKLKDEVVQTIFIATLLSETGLLHIDPAIAQKDGDFSPEEWRFYQGHVAISKSFADHVPNLSPRVGLAIIEHHERSDGFGYPFQKSGDQLCIESRIIAKVGTISAIYRKRVLAEGYSFSVIIPILQLNSSQNTQDVNNAALRVLSNVTVPAQEIDEARILTLIPKLLSLAQRLNKWLSHARVIAKEFKTELQHPSVTMHIAQYEKLNSILNSSGLLSPHQVDWLEGIAKNKTKKDYHVVEQYAVMLYELEYHCLRVKRNFEPVIPIVFSNSVKFKEMNEELHQLLL